MASPWFLCWLGHWLGLPECDLTQKQRGTLKVLPLLTLNLKDTFFRKGD